MFESLTNYQLINTYLNVGAVFFSMFLIGLIVKIKLDNARRQKHVIERLDHVIAQVKEMKKIQKEKKQNEV